MSTVDFHLKTQEFDLYDKLSLDPDSTNKIGGASFLVLIDGNDVEHDQLEISEFDNKVDLLIEGKYDQFGLFSISINRETGETSVACDEALEQFRIRLDITLTNEVGESESDDEQSE